MTELSQVLVNQTGSVVIGVIALYFFVKVSITFSKEASDMSNTFSKTIQDVSKEFSATIDRYLTKSTEASNLLASKLQELSDTNRELSESNRELRVSNEALYKRVYEVVKDRKRKSSS